MNQLIFILFAFLSLLLLSSAQKKSCDELKVGQFKCKEPKINETTQQAEYCREDNLAPIECEILPNLDCAGLINGTTFYRRIPCQYSSGKDFRTALLLSIFLGCFGIDRFYLGYVGIGLFKLCTFGMFFVWHLVDIILIALQIVQPADGTAYKMDYFGPKATNIIYSNWTVNY